mmetsp:Transcript_104533/g.181524  ORF Transcript_104533/g.181524 Transcript_104533/m.181524 type:complete len:252 (+) Transcript_104533:106-861(+)
MMQSGKRGPTSAAWTSTPSKAAKAEDEGEQWQCEKCGNMNFASRMHCNMRKCQAPKPQENWTCPSCGNDNFGNRLFCNMRSCQAAKPGLTLKEVQSMPAAATPGGAGGLQPPAWTCPACGNQNFPGRTKCNSKKCGHLPYPGSPAMTGMFGMQAATAGYVMQMMAKPSKGAAKGKPAPEGSWICVSCKNVNWPQRDTCNRRECGQPRVLVDGGAPPSTNPEGSWTCPGCSNVNWPDRTVCNRRNCGLPKPM